MFDDIRDTFCIDVFSAFAIKLLVLKLVSLAVKTDRLRWFRHVKYKDVAG